jgi:uncharacterized protein YrrD
MTLIIKLQSAYADYNELARRKGAFTMQFIEGAPVYDANDREIGRISHVVMNPNTHEVTHVVVRQGLIFTEDKVISIDRFEHTTQDRATLYETIEQIGELPTFEETQYLPAEAAEEIGVPAPTYPLAGAYYWYPSGAYPVGGPLGAPYVDQRYVPITEKNIPDGTIALKEGARVMSADDKHVGNIENIVVDPDTSRVSHLVIAQGLLFRSQKVVPAFWIKHTLEDEVYLSVTSDFLEDLPDYQR